MQSLSKRATRLPSFCITVIRQNVPKERKITMPVLRTAEQSGQYTPDLNNARISLWTVMENSGTQAVHSSFTALPTCTNGPCWLSGERQFGCVTANKWRGWCFSVKSFFCLLTLEAESDAFNAWKLGGVLYRSTFLAMGAVS